MLKIDSVETEYSEERIKVNFVTREWWGFCDNHVIVDRGEIVKYHLDYGTVLFNFKDNGDVNIVYYDHLNNRVIVVK